MSVFNATTSVEASNLFNVNGLVAVVTGGGTGLGLIMARALALNGAAKVYICGRREEPLLAAAASVPTGTIIPHVCDITSKEALSSFAQRVESETGYVNLLVANSGILGPTVAVPPTPTLQDFAAAHWAADDSVYSRTFDVNVTATWYTVLAFLDLLDKGNKKGNVEQKSQVVTTSSLAAFNRAAPSGFAYGQSKAAVVHMMKSLATTLLPWDIRCNTIAPGLYPSEMTEIHTHGPNRLQSEQRTLPRSVVPLQRPGDQEDMSGLILFLASRAGAYINGTVMLSDGGRLSQMPSSY